MPTSFLFLPSILNWPATNAQDPDLASPDLTKTACPGTFDQLYVA